MTDWLAPVRVVLGTTPAPVDVFFRDDDAGWGDERLLALLAVFDAHAAPLDLAVIPAALEEAMARELARRADRADGRLGLHQHGYAHVNHEPEGRKCEFGEARDAQAIRRDLAEGARLLAARLGPRLDAIFTPPWNRCSAATAALLSELGIAALSRARGATPAAPEGLSELPVAVDWCKHTRGPSPDFVVLGGRIAAALDAGAPAGIMLHHAVMDDAELERVHELLALLSTHRACRCLPMRALLPQAAGG